MRKITEKAVIALMNNKTFKSGNTKVNRLEGTNSTRGLTLHDNLIACMDDNRIFISNAGYKTRVTKERLNGVLLYLGLDLIKQREGVWYWQKKVFPTGGWVGLIEDADKDADKGNK